MNKQEKNYISESKFNNYDTRDKQLKKYFKFKHIEPICKDEYIKIPIDLPWKELAQDAYLAFEKYSWYGLIHRGKSTWDRSLLYGGLGLTYNPDYLFDLPLHAHALGQPRSSKTVAYEDWVNVLENKKADGSQDKFNSYADSLGLRIPTDVTRFRSFPTVFDKLQRQMFQGRIAEIRAAEYGNVSEESKEFRWHVDEDNFIVSRLLIPLVYDDDYYIEFKETGNRIYFEKGYAYHWNTKKIHRWSFDYHKNIKNRTCIIIGFSPWLELWHDTWTVNEYFNRVHPTDMLLNGDVI